MNASVRLSHFYNAAAGRPLACTAYPKPNPFSPRDEGARLRSLVDGGDEHARTGGDLLVIRGGRLALLGTQRSLEANTTVEALDARWMPGRV